MTQNVICWKQGNRQIQTVEVTVGGWVDDFKIYVGELMFINN